MARPPRRYRLRKGEGRERRKRAASAGAEPRRPTGGVMTSMVRAFRRTVGREPPPGGRSAGREWFWTVLLVLAALAFVLWRFR